MLARFDQLVLKPAFPDGITHPVFLSRLSSAARDEWRRRIQAEPARWVAQEELAISTAPVLVEDAGAGAQDSDRRAAGAAHAGAAHVRGQRLGGDPLVMPGALARVAGSADNPEVSMQVGSGSKDAWVMADGPVEAFSLLPPPSRPVALTRGSGDLPSQTADNLFWLGRYAERAEGIARLARVLLRAPGAGAGRGQPGRVHLGRADRAAAGAGRLRRSRRGAAAHPAAHRSSGRSAHGDGGHS